MITFLGKLFDSNEKQLKKYWPTVDTVQSFESAMKKRSDQELTEMTREFRKRLGVDLETARMPSDPFVSPQTKAELETQKAREREQLMEILPEAFAVAREAGRRAVVHHAFPVQVLAGVFLADGYVAELFTGEGKSLVATMPLYLYALMGRGANLVTVNDYLARRDGEWAGHIFNMLGMTTGIITPGASYRFVDDEEMLKIKGDDAKDAIVDRERVIKDSGRLLMSSMHGDNLVQCTKKEAYACDVVYGTNNEFGFDYLRDNMASSIDQRVQTNQFYSIVDECDSILIDEARTPLIISSSAEETNELYQQFARLVTALESEKDYVIDEKSSSVSLTDEGVEKSEKILGISNIWENYAYVHHIDNALKAKELYKRDDQYLVQKGEIRIVDEFTGRVLAGRRYSEGLHQAIEAKEQVEVKKESRTHATITFQNYFRLYSHLAGMTGTALTESEEFAQIYSLEVIVIPTNKTVIRTDYPDVVYRTREGKFKAVIDEIKEMNEIGRPVLVGTTSVEASETLSDMLSKQGVSHEVLNAKHHQKEAMIIAKAGSKNNVTISTNMAGRGTDISLSEEVIGLGGLHVIGTERHESRRIDNQLRGRSGRQGDPGSSRFYVSFEDDLMRIFGGDTMGSILTKVGMDDDMPIEAAMIGRSIESAQKRVEAYNFDTRKHLVEYDDVLNQQREIIYDMRRKVLAIAHSYEKERSNASKDTDTRVIEKYDYSLFEPDRLESVISAVKAITLKKPDSWNVQEMVGDIPLLLRPLRLWILRLTVDHIDFLISAQIEDDMNVDEKEGNKVLAGVLDVIPPDLSEQSVRKNGYKNWEEFSEAFIKEDDVAWQRQELYRHILVAYVLHLGSLGDAVVSDVERLLTLQTIDHLWVDHLDLMTDLRHGIGLRGYAQKNPLVEYKNEGFAMFDRMLARLEDNIVRRFYKVRVVARNPLSNARQVQASQESVQKGTVQADAESFGRSRISDLGHARSGGQSLPVPSHGDARPGAVSKQKTIVKGRKVGRNDQCPCGSGKKYKKCCYPKYD